MALNKDLAQKALSLLHPAENIGKGTPEEVARAQAAATIAIGHALLAILEQMEDTAKSK